MSCDSTRARRIVKLAAKDSKIAPIKQWLNDDPRGAFERAACRLLEIGEPRGRERGMTDAAIDTAVANEIAFQATDAMLRRAKRKKG
jgi:hypothetical protein